MAVFGINEADNYGSNGGGGYFSLKNDKDVANVRFLYDSVEDVQGFAVHEVDVNGKKRAVNCLRDYGQPIETCPFCQSGKPVRVKYYIPLYETKSGKTVIWERGKKFGAKLSSLCARFPHLVSHTFDIERNGKAGDEQTTYEIYHTGETPDVKLDDFESPTILGGLVLNKSVEDMQYYNDRQVFPDDNSAAPTRRVEEQPVRRTPAGNREVF